MKSKKSCNQTERSLCGFCGLKGAAPSPLSPFYPGSLPPGPKALPTSALHASFSHNWQQTAGGEACDLSSPAWRLRSTRIRGGLLVCKLPPLSPGGLHFELSALQRGGEDPEDPSSIPGITFSVPCPAGPLTWGQRSTFRTRRTAQPPRAVHSPPAVQPTRWPAHPSLHAHLLSLTCALSLSSTRASSVWHRAGLL